MTAFNFMCLFFQSTHPARGCDDNTSYVEDVARLSIHAPREGVRR